MTPDLPPPMDEVVHVEQSLADWAGDQCEADKVEVQWTGLDADRLPRGTERLVWQGDPCRGRPSVRVVAIVDGMPEARFTIQPSLSLWLHAPVAVRDTAAGTAIETEQRLVPYADVTGRTVSSGVARVFVAEGRPVTDSLVREPVDAENGAPVQLVYRRGNLVIEAEGRLLEDGHVGQSVRVVNDASHAVAHGTLLPNQTVEIRR